MEPILLIKSVLGLLVVLAILVFLLVMSYRNRKAKIVETKKLLETLKKAEETSHGILDLPSLLAIIKNKKSSTVELQEALDLILKYYGTIHPKLGSRTHPDYDTYMVILFTICRHPNTNKDIILGFNRALEKKNPSYKIEINEAITKGLNSRGV